MHSASSTAAIIHSTTSSQSASDRFQEKIDDIQYNLQLQGYLTGAETYTDFLLKNKIISPGETPRDMFRRIADTLAHACQGQSHYKEKIADHDAKTFYTYLTQFKIIVSTPIATNAGRHLQKPMSACAVPAIDWDEISTPELQQLVKKFHTDGMGTGFNLDEHSEPVEILKILNQFANDEVDAGLIERPVGNMAILSIDHPKAAEFIAVKTDNPDIKWKFNISVNLTEEFITAHKANRTYKAAAGHVISPAAYLEEIAHHSCATGDPGVVFMHAYEKNNKTPQFGNYISVAPCGEVGLLNGEVCHFASINLMAFVKPDLDLDLVELTKAIGIATLMLDNAIELTLQNSPSAETTHIVSSIRKIGIGVCGFADYLITRGMEYGSEASVQLAKNISALLNYHSKMASVNLARERQAFPAFHHTRTKIDLIIGPFIHTENSAINPEYWEFLAARMAKFGIRNVATVILPPTGRSAIMAGVSTSIEPLFKLIPNTQLRKAIQRLCNFSITEEHLDKHMQKIAATGSAAQTTLPANVKKILATCLEISADKHLAITAAFQTYTDEAISKTINLPAASKAAAVTAIILKAHELNLKGVSIYVDQSRKLQPKKLIINQTQSTIAQKQPAVKLRLDANGLPICIDEPVAVTDVIGVNKLRQQVSGIELTLRKGKYLREDETYLDFLAATHFISAEMKDSDLNTIFLHMATEYTKAGRHFYSSDEWANHSLRPFLQFLREFKIILPSATPVQIEPCKAICKEVISIEEPEALTFVAERAIHLPEKFITAAINNYEYVTSKNATISAQPLLNKLAEHICAQGNLSIVFLDEGEAYNTTFMYQGQFNTVLAESEALLLEGEICESALINLAEFVDASGEDVDYAALRLAVGNAVYMLDNSLELLIAKFPAQSKLLQQNRKIGIGVCGFANMLINLDIAYTSREAFNLAKDVMSFINYVSKQTSVLLARHRGACPASLNQETILNNIIDPLIATDSNSVSLEEWHQLALDIKKYGIRNMATIMQPASDQRALLAGVAEGIAPFPRLLLSKRLTSNFIRIYENDDEEDSNEEEIHEILTIMDETGSAAGTDLSANLKNVYVTQHDVSLKTQLQIAWAFAAFIDIPASTPISIPANTKPEEIVELILSAKKNNMFGIAFSLQKPLALTQELAETDIPRMRR